MANSSTTTATTTPTGGTALRGRIEAIGVFDLLRIAVTKGNTGRLLVFNDQFDAELYYVEGRLVAAIANALKGRDALKGVFEMTEGEFEFAQDIEAPTGQDDPALHDVMTAAIKSHYQERVRARQDSGTTPAIKTRPDSVGNMPVAKDRLDSVGNMPVAKDRPDSLSNMPAVRVSGMHRVAEDARVAVSPIVSIDQPTPPTSNASLGPIPTTVSLGHEDLLDGEFGRAITDSAGRTTLKRGNVSPQETALAALASKTAQTLATILGMRDLQRFEIIGENNRVLLCRVAKDGIHLSAASGTTDADAVWKELDT